MDGGSVDEVDGEEVKSFCGGCISGAGISKWWEEDIR